MALASAERGGHGGSVSHRKPRGGNRRADAPHAAALGDGMRCGGRKHRSSLVVGRLKCALPRWGERAKRRSRARRATDTAVEASCRSHASGAGSSGWLLQVTRQCGGWGAGEGGDVGRVDRQSRSAGAGKQLARGRDVGLVKICPLTPVGV
jgi:hypothetical protein